MFPLFFLLLHVTYYYFEHHAREGLGQRTFTGPDGLQSPIRIPDAGLSFISEKKCKYANNTLVILNEKINQNEKEREHVLMCCHFELLRECNKKQFLRSNFPESGNLKIH